MPVNDSKYDFVILTPGRSGSEHLIGTLNHFDDLEIHGEIFNRTNKDKNSFNMFCKMSLQKLLVSFFFNREMISANALNLPLKKLISRFLIALTPKTIPRKGFKLTLDQWEAYPYALEKLKKDSCKFIYLYRKDRLAQVLSLLKARQSNRYHTTTPKFLQEKTSLNPAEVKSMTKKLIRLEEKLFDSLKGQEILILSYEGLFTEYQYQIDRIRELLELSAKKITKYSDLKKQNPASPDEWVKNINDIKTEVYPLLANFPIK